MLRKIFCITLLDTNLSDFFSGLHMLQLHREATSGSPGSTEGYVICTIAACQAEWRACCEIAGKWSGSVDQRCESCDLDKGTPTSWGARFFPTKFNHIRDIRKVDTKSFYGLTLTRPKVWTFVDIRKVKNILARKNFLLRLRFKLTCQAAVLDLVNPRQQETIVDPLTGLLIDQIDA
jgi:hypothetical protein